MLHAKKWFSRKGRAVALMALVGLFGPIGCGAYSSAGGGYSSAEVGFSATYADLNPYGRWVMSAQFGQVWCPDGGSGWSPFFDGYWVWTDQGWYWNSYEPYGWLVYHYGNWYYDNQFGWCWLPGDNWSPAAVRWVVYDDYVCWAPIPPRGVSWPDPWQPSRTRVWSVVAAKNFTSQNLSRVQVDVSASRPVASGKVMRRSPDIRAINNKVDRPFSRVIVDRRPTVIGSKTLFRSSVPSQGRQLTERIKSTQKSKATESDDKPEVKKKRGRLPGPRGSGDRPHHPDI